MKASERRAFAAALPFVRCPSCNHPQLSVAAHRPTPAASCSCGWYGPVSVTFEQKPIQRGQNQRTVATIEIQRS